MIDFLYPLMHSTAVKNIMGKIIQQCDMKTTKLGTYVVAVVHGPINHTIIGVGGRTFTDQFKCNQMNSKIINVVYFIMLMIIKGESHGIVFLDKSLLHIAMPGLKTFYHTL